MYKVDILLNKYTEAMDIRLIIKEVIILMVTEAMEPMEEAMLMYMWIHIAVPVIMGEDM